VTVGVFTENARSDANLERFLVHLIDLSLFSLDLFLDVDEFVLDRVLLLLKFKDAFSNPFSISPRGLNQHVCVLLQFFCDFLIVFDKLRLGLSLQDIGLFKFQLLNCLVDLNLLFIKLSFFFDSLRQQIFKALQVVHAIDERLK